MNGLKDPLRTLKTLVKVSSSYVSGWIDVAKTSDSNAKAYNIF